MSREELIGADRVVADGMADLIRDKVYDPWNNTPEAIAEALVAAGFRHSEVPEPSAEHAYQGNLSQDTCWVMVDGEMCRKPIEAHVGTQGEPSDALLLSEHHEKLCGCVLDDCEFKAGRNAALRAVGGAS